VPNLSFHIESAEPVRFAAAPMIAFQLCIDNAEPTEQIRNILLECQVRIEAVQRRYDKGEQAALYDLFGEPSQWSRTLHSMLWTNINTSVPAFQGSIEIPLQVPCTFDLNVAATKYWYGLDAGEVPLTFLFSGTIFYESEEGFVQVSRIPWEREATFRLPVAVWQLMMDEYYPNSAWLNLRRDVFDKLYQYKMAHSIPTWEQALENLLALEAKVA
jgi:hypothetical protein